MASLGKGVGVQESDGEADTNKGTTTLQLPSHLAGLPRSVTTHVGQLNNYTENVDDLFETYVN